MMDTGSSPDVFLFDHFRFDRRSGSLSRQTPNGEPAAVNIGSRALAILGVLVGRAGDLVSKDEIMRAVWPGVAVEDANLTVQLTALRRALDTDRIEGSCILNVPGRGYRFLPEVRRLDDRVEPLGAAGTWANDGAVRQLPVAQTSGRRWPTKWSVLTVATFAATTAVLVGYGSRSHLFSHGTPPPRLSLVVLPFENLSGDPNDNYLAQGVTEDLITDLSLVPGMLVIARGTAYTYQGKSIDERRIGEQLGVRYVLEGSVRKVGDALRVNTQLVATNTAAHLWADRFDLKLNNFSAGQEEIVYRIGRTLNVALADIELARSKLDQPTNPDAFDLVLRARSLFLHPIGPREQVQCIDLLERALRLDPNSIYPMTQLAYLFTLAHRSGTANADDLNRAAGLIAAAAAIKPDDQGVLDSSAYLLMAKERYSEAIPAFEHLLNKYPNTENAYHRIGVSLIQLGRAELAIPMIERAIRLDPQGPSLNSRYSWMGLAYLLLGRDEEAIVWLQRSVAADQPSDAAFDFVDNVRLAAAYARLGRIDEAHRAIAEVKRLQPHLTVRTVWIGSLEQIERYQASLRLAGLRDHAEEDADFGVPADGNLRNRIPGLTPTTAPGATTIRTAALWQLLNDRKPIIIDAQWHVTGQSIPGAYAFRDAGLYGSMSDAMQDHLRKKMFELTKGDLATPTVAVGWNSESFDGYNLTLRLVALGYKNVYWYRGGREAWEVAGLPETKVDIQDW